MAYIMTANEKKIVENVKIPTYYNEIIIPEKRRQGRRDFREISDLRASGLCPFHDDTDPSLHYWKNNNMFKCFGCGKAGSIVQMHMYWEKEAHNRALSKEEAIKELAEMFQISIDLDETGEIKPESIFSSARKKFEIQTPGKKEVYNMSKLTIGGFRTFNNQLKNTVENNPYIDGEQAANLYYKLDLTLSAYLADSKEAR